jgi:hypothetical protein
MNASEQAIVGIIEKAIMDECFGGITAGGFEDNNDVRTMLNFDQFCKAVASNAARTAAKELANR